MWLAVSDSGDAARLAPIARMSWMLAGHVSDPSVATRLPARASAGGPAPDEPIALIPFLLGAMVMTKSVC